MVSPTVESPIAHQHQLPVNSMRPVRDHDAGLLFAHRLESGYDIGERTELLFQRPIHQFDRPGIQACAGELREVSAFLLFAFAILDDGEVNALFVPTLQDRPRGIRFERNSQLACENIHSAKG